MQAEGNGSEGNAATEGWEEIFHNKDQEQDTSSEVSDGEFDNYGGWDSMPTCTLLLAPINNAH